MNLRDNKPGSGVNEVELGNYYIQNMITGERLDKGNTLAFDPRDYTLGLFDANDYGDIFAESLRDTETTRFHVQGGEVSRASLTPESPESAESRLRTLRVRRWRMFPPNRSPLHPPTA